MCIYQQLNLALLFPEIIRTEKRIKFVIEHCGEALRLELPPNQHCKNATSVGPSEWVGKMKTKDRIRIEIRSEKEWHNIDSERKHGRQDSLCLRLNAYAENNQRLTELGRRFGEPQGAVPQGQSSSVDQSFPPVYQAVPVRAARVTTPPDASSLTDSTAIGSPPLFAGAENAPHDMPGEHAGPSNPVINPQSTLFRAPSQSSIAGQNAPVKSLGLPEGLVGPRRVPFRTENKATWVMRCKEFGLDEDEAKTIWKSYNYR